MFNTFAIKTMLKKKYYVYSTYRPDDFISSAYQCSGQRLFICSDKYFEYYQPKLLCCHPGNRNASLYFKRWKHRLICRIYCRPCRCFSGLFDYYPTLEYLYSHDIMFIHRYCNRCLARILDRLHTHTCVYRNIGGNAFMERSSVNHS